MNSKGRAAAASHDARASTFTQTRQTLLLRVRELRSQAQNKVPETFLGFFFFLSISSP